MWVAALPLLVAHVGLLLTFDLAAHPWWTLGWLSAGMAGVAYAVRRLRSVGGSGRVMAILLVAAALRLLLLPLPPTLSDDILRYVWDGRTVNAGFDPYRVAPDAPELEPLRDELWSRLPHRDVQTVYPPLAMTVFSIAARLPAPIYSLKLLLAGCDLLVCVLLLWVARAMGTPEERIAWYAWSPLATLETAGMGHVDTLGVLAVVATVLLLVRATRRPVAASMVAAAAVLTKLIPLVAFPVWARGSGRPWRFLAIGGVLVAVLLAPIVFSAGGVPPGLTRFGLSWEFNGPLYEPLWRLSEALEIDAAVESALDAQKTRSGEHEFWNRFYPFNYSRFHARLVLAVCAVAGLLWAWRREDLPAAVASTFGVVLIFSATVYPWYLLWILPWAALREQPAWLTLAALIPLSYLPQFTSVPLMPWVFAAIWLPFFTVLALRPRWTTG